MTRVSVVIPCYKQAHLLPVALDSVLAQEGVSVEVVVVDDGSPDDVAGVAARYGGRVRYVRRPNGGLSAARNTGIEASTGELLHFLDADDWLLPGTLAAYAEAARAEPDADVFHGGHVKVDPSGAKLDDTPPLPTPADMFHYLFRRANQWPVHAVVVRRRVFDRVGVFEPALRSLEDWDMWLRASAAGCRFVTVRVAGAVYRIAPGSMSHDKPVMWEAGNAVVARALRLHPDCRTCAAAASVVRKSARFQYRVVPVVGRLREAWAGGRYGDCARTLADCFRRDPQTARMAVREVLSSAKRHVRRRLRAGPVRPAGSAP